jgi:hypothetical protein
VRQAHGATRYKAVRSGSGRVLPCLVALPESPSGTQSTLSPWHTVAAMDNYYRIDAARSASEAPPLTRSADARWHACHRANPRYRARWGRPTALITAPGHTKRDSATEAYEGSRQSTRAATAYCRCGPGHYRSRRILDTLMTQQNDHDRVRANCTYRNGVRQSQLQLHAECTVVQTVTVAALPRLSQRLSGAQVNSVPTLGARVQVAHPPRLIAEQMQTY